MGGLDTILDSADPALIELLVNSSVSEIEEIYASMTHEEKAEFDALIRTAPPRNLMPHQVVPSPELAPWMEVYLLVGGRGTGKTVAGAYEARNHLRRLGPRARIGIGAPTNSDARDTCMEGETGLIKMFPNEFKYYNRSLGEARHIGGGFVKAMGTEKPGRWNGPQWSMIWFDELALCNQAAWDDANLGLRLPSCPHGNESNCVLCPQPYAVCTTTPKARKWVKALALDKTTYVPQYIDVETGKRRLPTTFDNNYLPARRVEWLRNKYAGSRLGMQELQGLFIDDVAGAKWKREWIEDARETDSSKWPRFQRILIAIDPAGSRARRTADTNSLTEDDRQNQRKNADTAVAAVALGIDRKFYVLEIKAGQWSPTEWAKESVRMYHRFRADKIVAEKNFGGEMVEAVLRGLNEYDHVSGRYLNGRNIPIKLVHASRGKDIRAEPVCTLYEQGRVVHTGVFGPAEDQMCAFVDADDNEGADMVDAVVWGITELGGLNVSSDIIIAAADPRFQAQVVHFR